VALKPAAVLVLLFALTVVAAVVCAAVGAVRYAPATVAAALFHPDSDAGYVLWSLRFPRIASAALVGAALGLAGTLLQSCLRNSLADPYLTGGSGGAALAIALAIAAGIDATAYAPLAFAAALGATSIAATLARIGGRVSVERLILAGIAISSLCASLTTLVILFTPRASATLSILAWLGGSFVGHGWRDVGAATVYALLGLIVAATALPALNALRAGELRAAALGIDIERTRWIVVGAASLLTGAAVSISGIIGFVGLVIPHLARAAVGTDVRWTAAASVPLGATVVLCADALARGIAPPLELPVGILLSILGVPAFLAIAARRPALA
jgi:iron complex transport system permease protein